MIDNYFRAYLPRFTAPLIDVYQRFGLTPNKITFIGLGIATFAAILVALDLPWLGILIWWLGRLFDGTDGIYARALNQATKYGAYLDIVCDMFAYGVMIFGFYFLYPELSHRWMMILFLYVLCCASALALGSLEKDLETKPRDNRGLRLGAGLAEGAETGLAYTAFLLFPEFIGFSSYAWILVLIATVIARTLLARDVLNESNET